MEDNCIFVMQDYGKFIIDIKSIMDTKSINRNQLRTLTGLRWDVVNKWYESNVVRVDLDVLARICYVLDCQVSDIIKYVDS